MRTRFQHENHERFFHSEFVAQAVTACALKAKAVVVGVIAEYHHHACITRMAFGQSVLHQPPTYGVFLVARRHGERAQPVSDDVKLRFERYPAKYNVPNDGAFRRLVYDVTGKWYRSEADVFNAVASLGTDTVKQVLQYHIIPTAIPFSAALKSDGAKLDTLLAGSSVTVDVRHYRPRVKLIDADTNDRDARVVKADVGGAASNGYAHGIDRVLRPIDLP